MQHSFHFVLIYTPLKLHHIFVIKEEQGPLRVC